MKRTKLIASLMICVLCLSFLVVGVWAVASSVLFNLNGTLKYYPEGVYVELSGQVYRGNSETDLKPLKSVDSNTNYTLEPITNFDNSTGEPSGNFPMESWNIGSLPFAPQQRYIMIEVNVTNYSEFGIGGIINTLVENDDISTVDGLFITSDSSEINYLKPNQSGKYKILIELTGKESISKNISVDFEFNITLDASECLSLKFTSNGDGTASVAAASSSRPIGDLIIPANVIIDGEINKVTAIGPNIYSFAYCNDLKSVTLPDSIISIGGSAFYGCSNLTKITLPDSIISIGGSAFYGCYNLTKINLPKGITKIPDYVFSGCVNLESLTISGEITYVGANAFNACSKLIKTEGEIQYIKAIVNGSLNEHFILYDATSSSMTNISVSDECKIIGSRAFYGCNSLTSIEIPKGVTSIGDSAFYGCGGLTSIEIPNGVTSIGDSAFYGCGGLTSIEIPNGVTSIGNRAFYGCTGLTSIKIPSGVSSIGNGAFNSCSNLEIIVDDSNTHYSSENGNLYNKNKTVLMNWCDEVSEIVIPNNILSLSPYVFYDCDNIESVTFESGSLLENIGNYAFYGCENLTNFEIPDNVTSIGNYAFYDCKGLTNIEIPGNVISIGCYALYGCTGLTSLTFENPNNWQRASDSGFNSNVSSLITLSNSSTNIRIFTKDTGGYPNYYWRRVV